MTRILLKLTDGCRFQEKCGIMKNYCIFWIVFMVLFIIGFLKTLFHMSAGYVIAEILFLGKFTQLLIHALNQPLLSIHGKGIYINHIS